MLDAAKQLHAQFPKLTFKMAVASKKIEAELDIRYSGVPIEFVYDSRALIAEAHASMVASGTVSLEHALIGTPLCGGVSVFVQDIISGCQVVGYEMTILR